jgi:hypothetical protein
LKYDTRIDEIIVYSLYPDNELGYNELYRKVTENYKRISFETFNSHISGLVVSKTLNKDDSQYRGKKVYYRLTSRSKKQVRLRIYESKTEREKNELLKESDSQRRLKLYLLILLGPFPQSDEPDEEFHINISEEKFAKIIKKRNISETDLRIIEDKVYEENTFPLLQEWELEFANGAVPGLMDLCYNKLKDNLESRPVLAKRIRNLERLCTTRQLNMMDLISGFFKITRCTTFRTPDNFVIERQEFGLKTEEYREQSFHFVDYDIKVRGFTISDIINQRKRKFFPHMQFTKKEIEEALNLAIEHEIIICRKFIGNRFLISDPDLDSLLDRLSKEIGSMLYTVSRLSELFRPTIQERQYLENFLGKTKTDRLFRRSPGYRHLEARFGYRKEYIDDMEKGGAFLKSKNKSPIDNIKRRTYKSVLEVCSRFRQEYSDTLTKYEVPLKNIMEMIYPIPLMKILSDKIRKLPA